MLIFTLSICLFYSFFFIPTSLQMLSGLSLLPEAKREALNHQSAFCSCGLRQSHAGLSVLPDRTTVPSGYPYTSSLTPMIFTCYREN